MDHFQCLEAAVKETLESLSKQVRKNQRDGVTSLSRPAVYATQIEKLHFNGVTHNVNRVFVHSEDYAEYNTVGWLLYHDVEQCIICSVAFGFFVYKYHCWACGNIVCNTCSPYNVEVEEIRSVGPKKVCLQCCWGQERVFAVHSYRDPNARMTLALQAAASASNSAYAASMTSANVSLSTKSDSSAHRFHQSPAPAPAPAPSLTPISTSASTLTPLTDNGTTSSGAMTNGNSALRQTSSASLTLSQSPVAPVTPTTPTSSKSHSNGVAIISGSASGYVVVQPVAGFVLKTWRTDADKCKVFINICSHPAVPYNSDESQPEKDVYKIVSELKRSSDKDGSPSIAADVIVHPNEIRFCEIDSRSRMRLCNQSILILQQLFNIPLDSNFKILKLISNYKGDDITQSFIPKIELFGVHLPSAETAATTLALYEQISPAQAMATMLASSAAISSTKLKSVPLCNTNQVTCKPTPGFVIKSKDAAGVKIFINLCHHECVPIHMPSSTLSALSKGRQQCFIFGVPEALPDGGRVVTCVVNSGTFAGIQQYLSNQQDQHFTKFAGQVVKRYNEEHHSSVDESSITFPRTKLGFKCKGSEETIPEIQFTLPSVPSASSQSLDSIEGMNPMLAEHSSRSLVEVAPVDRNTIIETSGIAVAVVSAATSLETVDNPMQLPGTQCFPIHNMLCSPQPGLVIGAVKESGHLLYINVCHAPEIGTVCPNYELPHTMAHLVLAGMGVVTYNHTPGASSKKNVSMDVIVSSDAYFRAMSNLESRDELVISILEFIGSFGVKLADEFTLPPVDGGYLVAPVLTGSCAPYRITSASTGTGANPNAVRTPIEDVYPLDSFNIYTDCTRRHQQVPVFIGDLYKRGHGHKTWKRRRIQFSGRRIKYYEKSTCKGDFDVKGCTIEVPITAENGAPTQFQFILHSQNTKDASLICCADTEDLRSLWIKIISIQCRMLAASASCMNCPPVRVGFMKKQGHMVRNWQKRYFVLDMGILRYYEKSAGKGIGENLKGQVSLAGSTVTMQGTDRIYISEGTERSKDMLLQVDEVANDGGDSLCSLWCKDLQEHIRFATENKHLVDIQSKE